MTCDGRCSSRRKQPVFSSFSRTAQSSGVAWTRAATLTPWRNLADCPTLAPRPRERHGRRQWTAVMEERRERVLIFFTLYLLATCGRLSWSMSAFERTWSSQSYRIAEMENAPLSTDVPRNVTGDNDDDDDDERNLYLAHLYLSPRVVGTTLTLRGRTFYESWPVH